MGYASLTFSGAAILYILTGENPAIHAQTSGVFLNLFAIATTGVMMLLYSSLDRLVKKENSIWERKITPLIIIAVSLFVFGIMIVVARLPLDNSIFLAAGYATGAVAVSVYVAAAVLTFRGRHSCTANDPIRLTISFILFAGASLNHVLILPSPSSQWIISVGLIALALIIANVSISYTFMLDIGVGDSFAYAVAIATSIMAVAPFILAHLITIVVGAETVFVDIGAAMLIHIGGAVLAGLSAYAQYKKPRVRSSPGLFAIVFLLAFWAMSEIFIILSHFLPSYSLEMKTGVPYVLGSIVSSLMLIVAVRRVLNPTKDERGSLPRLYVMGLICAPFLLLFSEFVRQYIFIPTMGGPQPIVGAALMLGLSFFSLYALMTYILARTGVSGGRWRFESVGAALASVWVIVVVLKANFGYMTAGWWIAEGILSFMTLSLSFLLLRMYLTASEELEKAGPVASAYSQMLSEKIVSHQKAAIDTLSQMTMDTHTDELRLDSLAKTLNEVSRANDLAKYLQIVVSGNRFHEEDLESIDVVDSITTAMNRSKVPDSVRRFKDEPLEPRTRLVHANALLGDLFYYLFEGISKRIGPIEMLGTGIHEQAKQPVSDIEVTFDILVRSEKMDQRLSLIKRYFASYSPDVMEFAYSRRLVELFGGNIEWHTEIASSQNLLITVRITLPGVSVQ
jgi:hypothetical protein